MLRRSERIRKQPVREIYVEPKTPRKKTRGRKKVARRVSIKPDGNCLFRSVSYIICGTQTNHRTFRMMACATLETMRDELALTGKNVNVYVSRMRQDGEWGGELELIALSRVLQQTIRVNDCYSFPVENTEPPIELEFEAQHYTPKQ